MILTMTACDTAAKPFALASPFSSVAIVGETRERRGWYTGACACGGVHELMI